jgi:chaperone required for assembly of F1-ATPase
MLNIAKIKQNNFSAPELKHDGEIFCLYLDDTLLHSEKGAPFGLPKHDFMLQILNEWQTAPQNIDLCLMPYTRICGALLDFESEYRPSQGQTIIEYVNGDLLLLHAPDNKVLFERQQALYNNIIKQIELALGIKYNISHQLLPATQAEQTTRKIDNWVSQTNDEIFLAIYILTQTLSSFALSFALINRMIDYEIAIKAAWLEHDIQMQKWGEDTELLAKRTQDIATIKAIMSLV